MQTRQNSTFGPTIVLSPSQQIAISRFVSRTYAWMFVGLLVTGVTSYYVSSSQQLVQTILLNRWLMIGLMIAQLGLVLGLTAAMNRLSSAAATFGFIGYSFLSGITFATIFLIYTMSSIGQVFMITSGMFGGLALYGTITKKDLTSIGSFVGMGLWGLILVGLANMFIGSESLNLGLAVAGVVIFAGLTAYDSQRIKAMAAHYAMNEHADAGRNEADKGAVFGALMLYLNFINLFLSLLRLFGSRRD